MTGPAPVPVRYAPDFYETLTEQIRWLTANVSADYAGRVYDEAMMTAAGLATWPRSYDYATERGAGEFPRDAELRQAAFGVGRRKTHRVIFRVRPDTGPATAVEVLAVRAAA